MSRNLTDHSDSDASQEVDTPEIPRRMHYDPEDPDSFNALLNLPSVDFFHICRECENTSSPQRSQCHNHSQQDFRLASPPLLSPPASPEDANRLQESEGEQGGPLRDFSDLDWSRIDALDEDDLTSPVALIGRQLAVIGDAINDQYASHFRRMTQALTTRGCCRCSYITSLATHLARGWCAHVQGYFTSFLPSLLEHAHRWLTAHLKTLIHQCLQLSVQWKSLCNQVEKTTHIPMAGVVMATATVATIAGVIYGTCNT